MEQLEGTWPERVLTHAAQLDRPLRGRPRRLRGRGPRRADRRVFTTRPDTLFGATFLVVAADAALAAELVTRRAAAGVRGLPGARSARRPRSSGCRPTGRRPASSWACTRSTRSTASGSRSGPPTTCWPTTAPARSWPCPAHDQRDLDFARAFDLPIVRTRAAAGDGLRAARRYTGDGPGVNSGQRRDRAGRHGASTRPSARSSRWLEAAGRRRGRGQLPAARLAAVAASATGARRSRSSTATTCGEVPVPDDQLPVELPELTRRRPEAEGRLAAGRRRRTGSTSTARRAAARRSATPTRWTRSSTRRGTSCATARRTTTTGPFDREPVRQLDAGRHLHRRRRARDAAPAVRALLHQGAARHGHGRLRRAVLGAC